MASIKNLKKDINYTFGDLIEECYVWELLNPEADNTKSQAIIDESIVAFDSFIDRVHDKKNTNRKEHFKAINKDLEVKVREIANKINTL